MCKKQFFLLGTIVFFLAFEVALRFSALDNLIIQNIECAFNRGLRNPARWIDIIQHTTTLGLLVLLNIYFLLFTRFGKNVRDGVSEDFRLNFHKCFSKNTLPLFGFIVFFLFLVYFKVFAADFFYSDDVFRNYGGNRSWIGFSRYISEFGSILIHNNFKLNDIAPLSQFLSVIISTVTVFVLSVALTGQLNLKNCMALSTVFIAPCYAECISYRFDSPYMAISLFFAALPFLFKTDKKIFLYVSVVCLLLTCMSYQAALSLYILCAIYLFVKDFIANFDLKKYCYSSLVSVASFAIALVLFKLLLMNKMDQTPDDYFSSRIVFAAIIPNAIEYFKKSFLFHGGVFSKTCFVLTVIYLIISFVKYVRCKKKFALIFIMVVLTISYILSFGPYLVFERPVFAPRSFMGFNVFAAFVLLACLNISPDKTSKFSLVMTFVFIYSFVVFMFTYGNCLKNQKEYENFRVQMIIKDLSENLTKEDKVNVSFLGKVDFCQKSRVALKNYPILNVLVPRLPTESSSWNDELLGGYNLNCECEPKSLTEDYILKKQTMYHNIYQNGLDFIIVLKEP